MTPSSQHIESAAEIIGLVGRIAVSPDSYEFRHVALLDGVRDLVDADGWLWFDAAVGAPGGDGALILIPKRGIDNKIDALLVASTEDPGWSSLVSPILSDLSVSASDVVLVRVCDRGDLWRDLGISPLILSARWIKDGLFSVIVFYRMFERPPLTETEAQTAIVVMEGASDMHGGTRSEEIPGVSVDLSPRLREVFDCLMLGKTRKEIAEGLDLSIHTVGEYVATIYLRHGVHSQAALISKSRTGNSA